MNSNRSNMSRNNNRITPLALRHRQQGHAEWKESLRRACLDRARNNRKDVLWKRRLVEQQGCEAQQEAAIGGVGGELDYNTQNNNNPQSNVRTVVEQELRQQGISVGSPTSSSTRTASSSTSPDTRRFQDQVVIGSDQNMVVGNGNNNDPWDAMIFERENNNNATPDTTRHSNTTTIRSSTYDRQNSYDSDSTEYVISEEELYELLQDVEEEMLRSEEELFEEVLEQERNQQQDIEDQIADFEEWEHSLAAAAASHSSNTTTIIEQVVCPICCESMLQQQSPFGSIFCPNEACSFRLGAMPQPPSPLLYAPPLLIGQQQQQQPNTVSLAELKERLRRAFENHSMRCQGTLTFEMQPIIAERCAEGECLVGSCQQCNVRLSIT